MQSENPERKKEQRWMKRIVQKKGKLKKKVFWFEKNKKNKKKGSRMEAYKEKVCEIMINDKNIKI